MSVHQAILASDSHNSKPRSSAPKSPRRSIALYSPLRAHFARKTKKDASNLVQSERNSFAINRNLQKIAPGKRGKTSQIDPNSIFFDPFQAFSGTCPFAESSPHPAGFLAPLLPVPAPVKEVDSSLLALGIGYWLAGSCCGLGMGWPLRLR